MNKPANQFTTQRGRVYLNLCSQSIKSVVGLIRTVLAARLRNQPNSSLFRICGSHVVSYSGACSKIMLQKCLKYTSKCI